MRIISGLLALTLLAACGADGEPARPSLDTTVSISNSGVRVGTNLGVTKGPLRIGLSL